MPQPRDADKPAGGGWRFQALGFDISVPWNALIGIIVIAVLWYPEFSGPFGAAGTWILAAIFGLLLMISILLHELAHAISARSLGYHVTGVTLWAMGGYTTYRTSEKHGPAREALIAAAGPVATLAIAAAAWAIANPLAPASVLGSVLWALAYANLLVGIFNLLPGSPLDGGAIVKSIVWGATGSETTGQVVSAWIGRGLAVVLAISPFVLAFTLGGSPSLPLIIITLMLAVILWTGASSSLKSAEANKVLLGLRATEISQPIVAVPASSTLAEVAGQLQPDVFVVALNANREPIGVVTPAAAAAVPADQRARVQVMAVSARIEGLASVAAGGSAKDVLKACQEKGSRFVAVVDDSGPIGLIDTDAMFVAEGP
jgi:Zn-dependent protease